MHEIKFVKNMVAALNKEAQNLDSGAIKIIYIEVGDGLTELSPEVIRHSFAHLDKHEKLKNAELKITPVSGNVFNVKKIEW